MNFPEIKPKDWITIGSTRAVVCRILEKSEATLRVEVVYLDNKEQAIGEEVSWQSGNWEFTSPDGVYADKFSRFNEFVSQLRFGHHKK